MCAGHSQRADGFERKAILQKAAASFSEKWTVSLWIVTPIGLVNIPAVRTYHPPKYPTPIIAAGAGELWAKQRTRDEANSELAKNRRTGHLAAIIDYDLRCRNQACPC
jgi:hypothetical protein